MMTDVILEHEPLRNLFLKRYNTLQIDKDTLVKEMIEDGIVMDKKRLQRFIQYGFQKRITQEAYIWLLIRHGIEIGISGTLFNNRSDLNNRLKAKAFTLK